MAPASPPFASGLNARRVALATLVVCAVALCFWLLLHYYIVPFIVFVGIVLGTAIRPVVNWLGRRGLPRALGVVVVYILLLALIAGFGLLVVPLLTDQTSSIAARLPEYYDSFRKSLLFTHNRLLQLLTWQLPAQLPAPGANAVTPETAGAVAGGAPAAQAAQDATAALSGAAQLLGYISLLGQAIFVGASILGLAFYWTLDGERTVRGLLLRAPVDMRENVRELIATMEAKVAAYILGQTIVCLSVGLMALAAYLLIGLPYALVLAAIAAVFEAVPVIGPILGAVPAAFLALSLAPDKLIWVVVSTIVVQQVENNLLVPRVMDRSVGVNPIVSILAIAAFAGLFGLAGALLAIPLAAILQVMLYRFVLRPEATEIQQPEGRDRVSILRYEAQDLVNDVRKHVRDKDDVVENQADQLEDMIEAIATDLDSMLAQARQAEGVA